jgi:hypothetical protein
MLNFFPDPNDESFLYEILFRLKCFLVIMTPDATTKASTRFTSTRNWESWNWKVRITDADASDGKRVTDV